MPVHVVLAEWRRLLRAGGTIGFSTMRAGCPQAAQLFRDCAADLGIRLVDASAALGSESLASAALQRAGFVKITVVPDRVRFGDADLSRAWESNLRWADEVRNLAPATLEALRLRFERMLDERRRSDPSFAVAEVLYAYAQK